MYSGILYQLDFRNSHSVVKVKEQTQLPFYGFPHLYYQNVLNDDSSQSQFNMVLFLIKSCAHNENFGFHNKYCIHIF